MAPKTKKDPNAPTLIPEDTFVRAKKLQDLKVAMKPPKPGTDLTAEEWCLPPFLHSMPEFKQTIHFWSQCAVVKYAEREGTKVPSRLKGIDLESTVKKPHPRKEIQDLFKFTKSQVKGANKRTNQFLKQLEKKENKQLKRETLLKQIKDVDEQMNRELRLARSFAEKQQLFLKKYMIGTKLGESAPIRNALIVLELSDKQQQWIDETKDEAVKLINTVFEACTDTFNVATFSASSVNCWCPNYQSKTDPKKGLADALKWINKNFSARNASSQGFPPDYVNMLERFTGEGTTPPSRIFLCVSRSPEYTNAEILEVISSARENVKPSVKNEPVLPINIVAFDPTAVGDSQEVAFFQQLAGESGSFMFDTSAEDLVALDKMLKSVQVKKKQLDKLYKKLDKMEDLSDRVAEDRKLLQVQISLKTMLESDFEIIDWALKNEAVPAGPSI